LAEGTTRLVAPVMTLDFITAYDSNQRSISREALYHILGFGAGVYDIEPWNNNNAIFGRTLSSFVAQFASGAIGVPAASFKLVNDATHLLAQNDQVVTAVDNWANPEEALGFVSGSNATKGYNSQKTRTLAYQHTDQTCAYLPDSEEGKPDRANVRNGQYYIWTPAWFYTQVDEHNVPVDENVAKLVSWFDGSLETPEGYLAVFNRSTADPLDDIEIDNIQETIVLAGDVPLCAMHAMRRQGDFSAIESYVPDEPCNGWYEDIAFGGDAYQTCDVSTQCDGYDDGERCRFGFCEAH
jgi:hypothetical protein